MKLLEFIEVAKRLHDEYGNLEIKTFSNGEYQPISLHLSSDSETGHFISVLNHPRYIWELFADSDRTLRSKPEPLGLFVRSESMAKDFVNESPWFRSYVMTFETPDMTEVLAVDDATIRVGMYKQGIKIQELKKQRHMELYATR